MAKVHSGGSDVEHPAVPLPPLYGEGYDTIESLLDGRFANLIDRSPFHQIDIGYWSIIIFLGLILLTKVLASAATNGGGGCGGIFAPSLYIGCIAGFLFSHILNYFGTSIELSEKNFALMGMAGTMAGVMHAPLTGVFLIAELTGVRFVPSADDRIDQLVRNDQGLRTA